MMEIKPLDGTNILELTIDGAAGAAEFDAVLAACEQAIAEHGRIKLLKVVHSLALPPIPPSKFADDLKFGFEHLKDISHAVVVTDLGWVSAWARLLNPLFKAELRSFPMAELEAARAWLRAA